VEFINEKFKKELSEYSNEVEKYMNEETKGFVKKNIEEIISKINYIGIFDEEKKNRMDMIKKIFLK
jgi:hypothetical protein